MTRWQWKPHIWKRDGWWHCAIASDICDKVGVSSTPKAAFMKWIIENGLCPPKAA